MSKTNLDAGIPVLTEIIPGDAVAAPAKPLPMFTKPAAPTEVAEVAEVVDVPLIDGWLTEEWNRLERKIGGRILQQVMARIEADIETRVRDALADVLQISVENMANEVKQGLQQSLEQVIAKAVHQEISNMQIAKK
jgi:hypothetical protein